MKYSPFFFHFKHYTDSFVFKLFQRMFSWQITIPCLHKHVAREDAIDYNREKASTANVKSAWICWFPVWGDSGGATILNNILVHSSPQSRHGIGRQSTKDKQQHRVEKYVKHTSTALWIGKGVIYKPMSAYHAGVNVVHKYQVAHRCADTHTPGTEHRDWKWEYRARTSHCH
jgi:hypothetical protein